MGINWNTVPAFYNDSYTYMEWLGKVTAKVEDHETRLIQAEADIDELQDDVAGIKLTLADHEQRIGKNEDDIADIKGDIDDIKDDIDAINDDIDALETSVGTLTNWYTDHAADAVAWVELMYSDVNNALSTTIPALQEQTAENTANIIELQRKGVPQFQRVTSTSTVDTSGTTWKILTTYTPLPQLTKAIDARYVIRLDYNGEMKSFYIHDLCAPIDNLGVAYHIDTTDPSKISIFVYTISLTSSGNITLTPGNIIWNGASVAISDVAVGYISTVDIVIYPGTQITPTAEKLAYQASVQIFTDKTIPIDSRTASIIMQYYSAASVDPSITWSTWAADYNTAHPGGLQLDTSSFPDTNKDGVINAIDASNILTYYSNASAGRTQYEHSDADAFYNWYLDGNPPRWEY